VQELPEGSIDEQSPISEAFLRSSDALQEASQIPASRTPSKQIDAVHVFPGFGLFVQVRPDASVATQSPISAAFVKSTEASQRAVPNTPHMQS